MNIFKCLFLSRISHCHWEDLHTIKLIGEELLYWQFPYKKPKTEIYILKSKRATLSSLAMREFTTKEDLNSYKEIGTSTYQFKTLVYLKIKKELFSMKKTFIQKIFVVLKLSAFYFEISSFSSPGGCHFHIALTAANMWHGSVLRYWCTSRIFKRQRFNFYMYSKIGANLYQEQLRMEQLNS